MNLEEWLQALVKGSKGIREDWTYIYHPNSKTIEAIHMGDPIDYNPLSWYRENYRHYTKCLELEDIIFVGGE